MPARWSQSIFSPLLNHDDPPLALALVGVDGLTAESPRTLLDANPSGESIPNHHDSSARLPNTSATVLRCSIHLGNLNPSRGLLPARLNGLSL
jgi:hypothetical protein